MFEFKNVSLKFNKIIFNNFSYNFLDNGLYVIKGTSGVGKTTLLKLLFLNKIKYDGEILYNGVNIKRYNDFDVDLKRNEISYIAVKNNCLPNKTVRDNFKCILKNNYNEEKLIKYLKEFDLGNCLNVKFKYLSAGEKESALLLVPLLKKSKIVLIDEGFANLDSFRIEKFLKLYQNLAKNSLVIMVEHNCEFKDIDETIIDFDLLNKNEIVKNEKKNRLKKNFDFFKHISIGEAIIYVALLIVYSLFLSIFLYSIKIDFASDAYKEAEAIKNTNLATIFLNDTIDPKLYNLENNKMNYWSNSNYLITDYLYIDNKKIKLEDYKIYSINDYIPNNNEGEYRFLEYHNLEFEKLELNDIKQIYENSIDDFYEENPTIFADELYVNKKTFIYINQYFYNSSFVTINNKPFIIQPDFINNDEFYYKLNSENECVISTYPSFDGWYDSNIDFEIIVGTKIIKKSFFVNKTRLCFANVELDKYMNYGTTVTNYLNNCNLNECGSIVVPRSFYYEYIAPNCKSFGEILDEIAIREAYYVTSDVKLEELCKLNDTIKFHTNKEIFKINRSNYYNYMLEQINSKYYDNKYLAIVGVCGSVILCISFVFLFLRKKYKFLLQASIPIQQILKLYKIVDLFIIVFVTIFSTIFSKIISLLLSLDNIKISWNISYFLFYSLILGIISYIIISLFRFCCLKIMKSRL